MADEKRFIDSIKTKCLTSIQIIPMKEITIQIPEESTELVIELVLRLGGSIEKEDLEKKKRSTKVLKSKTGKSSTSEKKDTPFALFGKYPNFPLHPETYRNDLWKREMEL